MDREQNRKTQSNIGKIHKISAAMTDLDTALFNAEKVERLSVILQRFCLLCENLLETWKKFDNCLQESSAVMNDMIELYAELTKQEIPPDNDN